MNGTRLGRGRGGRLAVYGGCGIVVILLVFLYQTATTEMTRLRDLTIQCSNQQEALAAQLQVIFEYKVRLEKSLAEEKNSNAAAKRELQERANREKSLRDKDSLEALSRYKSLQQQHKLLQSEIQDLRDECDKEQKRALEESNKLESTLQDLRSKLRKEEEKDKNLEHLKNKYIELEIDKKKVDEKYSELLKNTGNTDSTVEHLRKEVFQLQRELEESKLSCKGKDISVNFADLKPKEPAAEPSLKKPPSENSIPAMSSSQQPQQVSQPSNNVDNSPQPIQAPRRQQIVESAENLDGNDGENNVRFIQLNGMIVPADAKEINSHLRVLPPPYVLNDINSNKNNNDNKMSGTIQKPMKSDNVDESNNNNNVANAVLPMPGPIQNNDSGNQKPSSTMQNHSENTKAQSPDESLPDEKQRNLQSPLRLNK